jgi:hypothetical protein
LAKFILDEAHHVQTVVATKSERSAGKGRGGDSAGELDDP